MLGLGALYMYFRILHKWEIFGKKQLRGMGKCDMMVGANQGGFRKVGRGFCCGTGSGGYRNTGGKI